jgi:hypothetical protein
MTYMRKYEVDLKSKIEDTIVTRKSRRCEKHCTSNKIIEGNRKVNLCRLAKK